MSRGGRRALAAPGIPALLAASWVLWWRLAGWDGPLGPDCRDRAAPLCGDASLPALVLAAAALSVALHWSGCLAGLTAGRWAGRAIPLARAAPGAAALAAMWAWGLSDLTGLARTEWLEVPALWGSLMLATLGGGCVGPLAAYHLLGRPRAAARSGGGA